MGWVGLGLSWIGLGCVRRRQKNAHGRRFSDASIDDHKTRRKKNDAQLALLPSPCHLNLEEPQSHFWGQTTQISSNLFPKRDCCSERVNKNNSTFLLTERASTWYLVGNMGSATTDSATTIIIILVVELTRCFAETQTLMFDWSRSDV